MPDSNGNNDETIGQIHDRWSRAIGRLLMSLGEVELITLHALKEFPRDPIFDVVYTLPLSRRIDLIKRILQPRPDPEGEVSTFLTLLNRVESFIEIRNVVAHNPASVPIYESPATGEVRLGKDLHVASPRNANNTVTYAEVTDAADSVESLLPDLWTAFYRVNR